jgi:hypothetical protein
MATYDEMINKLSPEQVRQMFNQGFPSELPQSKTIMDYINPASYVDPIAPLLNRGADPARVMPDPTDASANRSSMPSFNLGNLTNYIPSASTIGEYIPKEIPNVFGVNNPLYAGLLGADQSQALSKQSNVAGLLGAAAALVQGMGRQGGRRSAAGNIINALGAGYGSAGQAYQQGLQSYGQAQQLALQQRQQAAIEAMKLKYPEYADEIAANPSGAFRLIAEREATAKKPTVVSQGGTLVDPTGKVLFTAPSETKPEKQEVFTGDYGNLALTMFGTARASELSDPQRQALGKRADQLGIGKPASTNLTVNTGELSKGTKGELEKTILSTGDAVTRLNDIQASYRPEYQTIPFKGAQQWSTLKDKFSTLKPNEQSQLSRFAQYRQNTTQNLNLTIKELTGAAMGEKEAERIISTLPNAGTSIFDGDSPTEFKSKLDNALQKTKWALARKNYSLRNNLEWKNIPLDKVPEIVNKRGKEIEKAYDLDPNDPATEITVQRQLAAEFGISLR